MDSSLSSPPVLQSSEIITDFENQNLLAAPETSGGFLFGLRLMAIAGTTEDVADTPANEAAFGWHENDRGPSAFPQVKGVYLVECGF